MCTGVCRGGRTWCGGTVEDERVGVDAVVPAGKVEGTRRRCFSHEGSGSTRTGAVVATKAAAAHGEGVNYATKAVAAQGKGAVVWGHGDCLVVDRRKAIDE